MNQADSSVLNAKLFLMVGQVYAYEGRERIQGRGVVKLYTVYVYTKKTIRPLSFNEYFKQCTQKLCLHKNETVPPLFTVSSIFC